MFVVLTMCLLSGNNYQKISAFANVLKLPIVNTSTYHRIQRTYLVPSIDQFWIDHQDSILREYVGKDVVVLGDGRMDIPGHCAQYCSYTLMEMESKTILCIITLDKRITKKKSTNLEKACFEKGLKFLKDAGINVVEVVTDAHVQIGALMKKHQYADVCHSFDIWHGTKNLGKKIIKVSQEKGQKNKPLLEWTKDIVNHYWHCASISDSTEEFQTTWYGILHHVVDEHEWIASYERRDISNTRCNHGPLPPDRNKSYLEKGSDAHNALRNIVMDKRLLNNIHYYLKCRSTSDLETFQNLILTYVSKRHLYTPPVYRARNRLAALDHNNHLARNVVVKEDGSQRWRRTYNKKSARWSVQPIKEKKKFPHIPDLVRKIVKMRLEDNMGMNRNVVLEVDDPRRVSKNLAPVPPPPTQEIVETQCSRFEDLDKTIDYVYQEPNTNN